MDQLAAKGLRAAGIIPPEHQRPPLNDECAVLQAAVDAHARMRRHDIHFLTYAQKLDAALAKFPRFRHSPALWLLRNPHRVPREIRIALHHHAGGRVNHRMFWRAMWPGAAGQPNGLLRDAINFYFGSVAEFRMRFEEEGAKLFGSAWDNATRFEAGSARRFGSAWGWLARTRQDDAMAESVTAGGRHRPMDEARYPLFLDEWQHVYYLHYESRCPDCMKAWWTTAEWEPAVPAPGSPATPH